MMLMIVGGISSCGFLGSERVIIQPAKIRVVIPSEPVAPNLARQLPESLRLDVELAGYYREACNAYEAGDQPDVAVMSQYGLGRSSACQWAADCYTIQDGLTLDHIGLQQADYAERLRAWGRSLQSIIKSIEEQTNAKTNAND